MVQNTNFNCLLLTHKKMSNPLLIPTIHHFHSRKKGRNEKISQESKSKIIKKATLDEMRSSSREDYEDLKR